MRHPHLPSCRHFSGTIAAAQHEDARAFESLYAGVAPIVAAYLRVQGADDPEDLTSEVMLGAFKAIAGFSGDEGDWRTWVLAIAHRRLIDERRRRARRVSTVELDPHASRDSRLRLEATSPAAEDQALDRMGTAWMQALCGTLAPDQHDVVLLRLAADLTVDQVATALGKSPGAIKALQRRGVEALRRQLRTETLPDAVPL